MKLAFLFIGFAIGYSYALRGGFTINRDKGFYTICGPQNNCVGGSLEVRYFKRKL